MSTRFIQRQLAQQILLRLLFYDCSNILIATNFDHGRLIHRRTAPMAPPYHIVHSMQAQGTRKEHQRLRNMMASLHGLSDDMKQLCSEYYTG